MPLSDGVRKTFSTLPLEHIKPLGAMVEDEIQGKWEKNFYSATLIALGKTKAHYNRGASESLRGVPATLNMSSNSHFAGSKEEMDSYDAGKNNTRQI